MFPSAIKKGAAGPGRPLLSPEAFLLLKAGMTKKEAEDVRGDRQIYLGTQGLHFGALRSLALG
jgi:hypothetical protein